MSHPIRVRQIDHVTLVVRDLERSRWFYADVLGMASTTRPGFRFPGLWFQAGTTQIHLIGVHPESGPAGVYRPETCQMSRTAHFAFEVDDATSAQMSLEEQGVPLVDGPKQRPDGFTQIYVLDPDDYLVELFSKPQS